MIITQKRLFYKDYFLRIRYNFCLKYNNLSGIFYFMKFKKYILITILICLLSCPFIHNPFKDSGSFLVDTVYDTTDGQTTTSVILTIDNTTTLPKTSSSIIENTTTTSNNSSTTIGDTTTSLSTTTSTNYDASTSTTLVTTIQSTTSSIAISTTTTTTIQPELYCNKNTINFYTKLKEEYLNSFFEISNLGSGSIEYEVTSDNQSVSFNKNNGVVNTNIETIDLTIDTADLDLGDNTIVVTVTAVNPPNVINPVKNITINFNLETDSVSGKTFCKLSGSGDTQKISWGVLPADTTTDLKVYYYTNDYSNNDLNLDFNGKFNLLIPKSFNLITFIKDPVPPYKKDSYYIKLNSGAGDREVYIWKIEWDGGELFAEDYSELSGGAELVTP